MNYLQRRLQRLEQRRPHELPPLIIDPDLSPEDIRRIERETMLQYGVPALIITREHPDFTSWTEEK